MEGAAHASALGCAPDEYENRVIGFFSGVFADYGAPEQAVQFDRTSNAKVDAPVNDHRDHKTRPHLRAVSLTVLYHLTYARILWRG